MRSDIKKIQALVFFALMEGSIVKLDKTSKLFAKEFNAEIILKSRIIYFNQYSRYYDKEMGNEIFKQLFLTNKKIECHDLAQFKILSNDLEEKFSVDNKRTFNIDPGIVNMHQVVLASTKFSPHRVPISEDLWAEVTLLRCNKQWTSLIWTYKDYRSEEFQDFFKSARFFIRTELKDKD